MEDETPANSQAQNVEGSYSNSIITIRDQQATMRSLNKMLSCKREREFLVDSKIVVLMMKNLGIDECDKDVVDSLIEFNNYESILLILEEAKSRATYANKDTIGVNDIQTAIQMAKYVGFPRHNKLVTARPLLPNDPTSKLENPLDEPHFSGKNDTKIIDKTASEIINLAKQNLATENIDIPTQNNENLDYLPELTGMDFEKILENPYLLDFQEILKNPTDMDYEEVIENPQNNKEVIKDKVDGFNVEALLNDPYSL